MLKHLPFYYGWVILTVAVFCQFIAYSVRNSFAVFYIAILEEFGWSRADTALIFSISLLVYGLMSPFSGALIDRFGPRRVMPIGVALLALGTAGCSMATEIWHLYILFGVVVAIGTCFTAFVPNMAVLANWFVRRRGAAIGIFAAGWGISFLSVPLAQYLISIFDWRSAYLIMGGATLVILMPLILVFHRHRPSDMGLLPDGDIEEEKTTATKTATINADSLVIDKKWVTTDWTLPRALRTARFWALFAANFLFWGMAVNLLVAHQVAFTVDVGFTAMLAATMVSVYGATAVLGNVCGFISDRIGRETAFYMGVVLFIFAITDFLLIGNSLSTWMLFLYAILVGAGVGLNAPVLVSSLADMFQGRNFGTINGFFIMGFGVGGAISPWLAGYIFDLTGGYIPSLLLIIGVAVVSGFLLRLAAPSKVRLVPGRALKAVPITH